MHKIDGVGATAESRFTEGSPSAGVLATSVTADWLNAVQDEIVAVIEAAGIELDKGQASQLQQALMARFNKRVLQVSSISELRATAGEFGGQQAALLGYDGLVPGLGALRVYWDALSTAIDNGRTVFAVAGVSVGRWRLMDITLGFMALKASSPGNHLVLKSTQANSATRMHIEPRGYVDEGTTAKLDMMFDDYDADQVNYRIFNAYLKTGASLLNSGQNGENGVAYLGAKSVGDHFGVFPGIHFGFGDETSPTAVPMKMYYFDTSDTAWRTPMMGAWRAGRSVNALDYMLANSKLYQAQNSGITGVSKPSHSSGIVSDGAIDWLFVRDYQASVSSIFPCVLIGDRDTMPKFGLPNVRMQIARPAAVWNGVKLQFLDSTNQPAISFYTNPDTDDLNIYSEKTGAYLRIDATGSFIQNNGFEWLMGRKVFSGGETSVPLSGAELISFNNAGATSVSSFTGRALQRFYVESQTANTTLVHGTNIKLAGAANKVLNVNEVLCFVMDQNGTIAKQVV